MRSQKPYIIVLGSEKGGTGKSTLAMHMAVTLLKEGYTVGTIDVDVHQGTLTRYLENRHYQNEISGQNLLLPEHLPIFQSKLESRSAAKEEEKFIFQETLIRLKDCHFIVIDTPGSENHLSQLAHFHANSIITPLNDSLIDLNMLVKLDGESHETLDVSDYSKMVLDIQKQRTLWNNNFVDWVVLRNRLSNLTSRNKEKVEQLLTLSANRMGFRLLDGLGERSIFHTLFLKGLTVLDLKESGIPLTLSHIAAKQELASLYKAIILGVEQNISVSMIIKSEENTMPTSQEAQLNQNFSWVKDSANEGEILFSDYNLKEESAFDAPLMIPTQKANLVKDALKNSNHYEIVKSKSR